MKPCHDLAKLVASVLKVPISKNPSPTSNNKAPAIRKSAPIRRESQEDHTIPTPIRVSPTVNMPSRSTQPYGFIANALTVCNKGLYP